MNEVEKTVRGMDSAARRAYLEARGWQQECVYRKDRWVQPWVHPTHDQPGGDTGHYTLAAAVRVAVAAELAPQVADDPAAVRRALAKQQPATDADVAAVAAVAAPEFGGDPS